MAVDGVNPLEAIGEAAGAAFGEALADGATAEDAFTAAADAASTAASDLGMSEEIVSALVTTSLEDFSAAIEAGTDALEAFDGAILKAFDVENPDETATPG